MLSAWIPGPPVPQGRARIAATGHHIMAPKSRVWRAGAVLVLRAARQGRAPIDQLCKVQVTAVVPRPQQRPTRTPPDVWKLHGRIPAGNAADVDNYAKAALDAAQDAGWLADDHLVVELVVRKVYAAVGEEPGLALHLEVA